ncbi:TonB-dependent siderophore receptor [Cellvibrio sp. PSBB006]|jgi:iron complex outermembrane receptor protein|uniref:TonB-dependent siderophore receptor n=1 Tax=Cellvibrio sp. PSBB006 TaxID=1987723 RepID=UPI000B3B39B1|nr:TonB-dependent receptor [Cellvibrio sp. PSBB006]ARU26215.1 TonB-dependent receptor [Cellvibrio sp. PSBB006]
MTTHNRFKRKELALLISLSCALAVPATLAQEDVVELETYTAEGQVEDTMGVMPTEPVKSVFGFGKTILETPRGVTSVSADMMESYNITDIDDLVLISPGAFTQSFFGVAGSLDVRGTPGEVYFRGVRRVNNPGNYPTPIGATDRIDIVRGPASPIYGPSKIGGYLNFEPKSARAETGQYLEKPAGEISITRGSWDKNVLSAEVGGPGAIGEKSLGYYIYAETENSGSYYDNSGTDQNILQASFNMDFSDSTRIEFGGMYHEYDGNQVAGWNRLTQDLIDNGTYITGTAQPVDLDGDGYNSPDEYDAWKDTFAEGWNNFFVPAGAATDANMDPAWALEDAGTTKLKGNQTLVSPEDQLVTTVTTLYFDVIHSVSDSFTITNKAFYEKLENINENAYGFSQFVDSYAFEDQLIFAFEAEHADWLKASYQISPSIRYTDFQQGDDFDYEYFDRRDLSGPSTALDRKLLATVTDSDYSNYLVGDYTDYGLAFLADYTIAENVGVLLGARYDYLDMTSTSVGEKIRGTPDSVTASETDDGVSWTASLSYTLPFGLTPYVTVSEQATIVMGQGSEISPGLITDGNAIADSELEEVGIKGSFLDDRLYFSAAWFNQTRTNFSAQDQVSNNTTESEGYEFETRFLVTSNFTLTAAMTHLEITNLTALDGGTQFGFQGAGDLTGVTDPSLFYGYVMQGLTLVGNETDALKSGIPENMYSLTGAYDFGNGYRFTASTVHADSTYSGFSKAVKLPSYTLFNAGISYNTDTWSLSLQGKNLTDEKYFRANFPDLFGSTIVLPELPRHFVASASFKF